MGNKALFLCTAFVLCPLALSGVTLEQSIRKGLESDPQIQQHISDYKALQYDLDKAMAGYKPTVVLNAAVGDEHTERKAPSPDETADLTRKEASLVATQNLFKGFETEYNVQEQRSRIRSTGYYVLQQADTAALRITETYLAVIRNKRLLDLERENVGTHERIYKMTREKNQAGLGRRSDLEQTESRMALAYANYIAQQNNYQDSIINFERVYGHRVSASYMEYPDKPGLPAPTLDELVGLALRFNPTLIVERGNIETQKAVYGRSKSAYYPKLDAELSADYQNNVDGYENDDRAYRAILRLYYNLYNGGSDEATRLQSLEKLTSQQLSLNEQERAVVEKLKLAWMSYQYYTDRIRCLELHAELSKKTANSYAEEYHLGRRSLLDLLNVELEYNSALKEVAVGRHELLYAYYRILDALGLISFSLNADIYERLSLERPEGVTFDVPVRLHYTQYGETPDYLDLSEVCRGALAPIVQSLFDPVADHAFPAEEPALTETPAVIIEETPAGTTIHAIKGINFAFASAEITPESEHAMQPLVDRLKADENLTVEIHGHTDNIGTFDNNQVLSKARADAARQVLADAGISRERITTFGHSFTQPITENDTPEGRMLNRRIEFFLKQRGPSHE